MYTKQAKQTAERSVRGYTIELEQILTQFRDVESALSMAHAELKQCDDKTQDILHDLELNDHTYHERGKLTTELVEIRRRRRVAKDTIELLNPLCTWLTNNSKQIHMLESVLGEMRKIDTKRANRQYWPKSMASSERSESTRTECTFRKHNNGSDERSESNAQTDPVCTTFDTGSSH